MLPWINASLARADFKFLNKHFGIVACFENGSI